MKTFHAIACMAIMLLATPLVAQTTEQYQKDSTQIAEERDILESTLYKLRDSLTQSIGMLDQKTAGASSKSKTSIKKAMRELTLYRDRVERDLQELETTSEKGWDTNAVMRINTSIDEVRREYKRIQQDVKPYLSARS